VKNNLLFFLSAESFFPPEVFSFLQKKRKFIEKHLERMYYYEMIFHFSN